MNILTIAMGIFVCLELMNVAMLYFTPGARRGNGIGVFNAWEKSKENDEVHQLVKYLIYWVAGTKLIFIGLLIVIIFTGDRNTQLFAVAGMILSILTFFWKLYPMIRRMDREDQVTPKGYSITLGVMIGTFVAAFLASFLVALLG